MTTKSSRIAERLYKLRLLSNDNECTEFINLVDQLRLLPNRNFDSLYFGKLVKIFSDETYSYEVMQELHTFVEQKYHFQQTTELFWTNLKFWHKRFKFAQDWYRFYLMGLYKKTPICIEIDAEIQRQSKLGLFLQPILHQIRQELESEL